jgi:ornithine decarboxylase
MTTTARVEPSLPRFATVEEAIERLKPGEPVYLLHPGKFVDAAERFLNHFPGDTMYAVKANPAPLVLDQVWAAGIRHYDTASLPEIELVRGRFPKAICHFMAPVRQAGAAKAAFEKFGVTDYVVDCEFELEKLLSEIRQPRKIRIFVRAATPPGGAALHLSDKFGAKKTEAVKLLRRVAESGAAPCMTFHVGSQCLSPRSYSKALEMVRSLAKTAGAELQAIDIGGGFPSTYIGDKVPKYELYFGAIKKALASFGDKAPPVLCEPGRALIAEGVTLINQVVLRKHRHLYMNDGRYGSFDELTIPKWTSQYAMRTYSLDAKHRVSPISGKKTKFKIYGPTCDTLDVLPHPLMLPEGIAAGDFIVFESIGAYSIALRTTFNGFYPDNWAIVGN